MQFFVKSVSYYNQIKFCVILNFIIQNTLIFFAVIFGKMSLHQNSKHIIKVKHGQITSPFKNHQTAAQSNSQNTPKWNTTGTKDSYQTHNATNTGKRLSVFEKHELDKQDKTQQRQSVIAYMPYPLDKLKLVTFIYKQKEFIPIKIMKSSDGSRQLELSQRIKKSKVKSNSTIRNLTISLLMSSTSKAKV